MQVNNKDSVTTNVERTQKSELQGTSEEFLQMFIAQLQNQDPTDPMESTDMVKNIAQLNQISYLEDMKDSLNKIADGESSLTLGDIGSLIDRTVSYSAVSASAGSYEGEVASYQPGVTLELVDQNGSKIRDIELNSQGEFTAEIGDGEGQAYFQVKQEGEVISQEVTLQGKVQGIDMLSGEVILDNQSTILYDNIKKIISGTYE